MLGAECLLYPLRQSDGGDGGSMTVVEALGRNCKEELLCCTLGRSNGGNDENARYVSLCSLRRNSNDCGTPDARRSYGNKPPLTDSY